MIAANHESQGAGDSPRRGTGARHVQVVDTFFGESGPDPAAAAGGNRAGVGDDGIWPRSFDYPVRAEVDTLGHGGVAHAQEDALGVLCHLFGCTAELAFLGGGKLFGFGCGVRPQRHFVPRAQQIAGHGIAHDAQT